MRKHHLLPAAGTVSLPLLLLFLGFAFPSAAQSGASGQWTWINGSNRGSDSSSGVFYVSPPVYGTLGVPSPDNQPGARGWAPTWTDNHGRLWLFGGYLYSTDSKIYSMNDLWEFDPSTNQWTWQGGSNSPPCSVVQGNMQCAQPGVYGTKGTSAAGNFPGGRYWAASWTDSDGNLWLFGGLGFDQIGQIGTLNDLWEFNPVTKLWTWVGGDATLPGSGCGNPGVYGTMGTPAAANNPGSLSTEYTWHDANGNAWLFGGNGCDVNGADGLPNNLWKFDSSLKEWAWIGGSSSFDVPLIHPSVYGTLGEFATGNVPGSRWLGAAWTSNDGHLWLFGGGGFDSQGNSGYLNELWQYDPARNQWAWMAGQSIMQCAPNANKQNCGNPGVYGTKGQPGAGNLPGGISQFPSWTGRDGHFWMMESSLHDVLWEFDPSTNEWTWVGGSSDGSAVFPVWGSIGTPAAANFPGSRFGSETWTDLSGNLWLFSGEIETPFPGNAALSDLWKYQPASAIQVPGPDFAVSASGAALSVQPGMSATTTVTITPSNGFDEPVSLACSGLPPGVTCSFSPSGVTPSSGAASSTLTLTDAAMAGIRRDRNPLFPLALSMAALIAVYRRPQRLVLLLVLGAAGMTLSIGCGGGKSGGGSHQPVTATITLTGTAGTLQHTATVALTLN
jgi:N-acetylneuraminic acid mutarotase